MARTVERVQLNRGSLSASTRRRGLALVVIVALLWRGFLLLRASRAGEALGASTSEPGLLGPFLGQDHTLMAFLTEGWWVGSPVYLAFCALESSLGLSGQGLLILQALLGVICAGVLYRLAVPWLGYPAALVASLLFSLTGVSAFGGLMLLPELMFAWASLLFLRHLVDLARQREPARCFTTGLAIGGLSLLSGFGILWLPFVLAWLPLGSRHFRGRGYLSATWRLLVGCFLVLSPGLLQGVMAHGAFVPPFANWSHDLAEGIRSPHLARSFDAGDPLDPAVRYELRRRDDEGGTGLQRFSRAWTQAPDPMITSIRRARAFLGGSHEFPAYLDTGQRELLGTQRIPLTSMALIAALAWLGGFALLGSLRIFAPLYFGVSLPLVVASSTGLSPQLWMAAMPFFCLLADTALPGSGWVAEARAPGCLSR